VSFSSSSSSIPFSANAVGWPNTNYELEMWANAQRDGRPAEYR